MADPIFSLNTVFFDESGRLDLSDAEAEMMGELPLIGVHMMLPMMTVTQEESGPVRERFMIERIDLPQRGVRRASA